MRPYDFIVKKRDGGTHGADEIKALVAAVVDGSMPDYQISAWLMAAFLNGLNEDEMLALTLAMRDSGERVDWSGLQGVKLDKHSSGGVGDKTSLVVVPLLAAAGIPIMKMSGRGLGFSGGTVDKLESIPGFRTGLSTSEAIAQVKRIGAAMIGQSPQLVPADKKLYALRDVTATIESIPLIAASIMSKKLAAGADVILLDVKVGRGAFMKTMDQARELAGAMVRIGKAAGIRTAAALTAMDEPLGYAVGNAVEVAEACALLTNSGPADDRFRDLCLYLSTKAMVLAGKATEPESARASLQQLMQTGRAASKFEEIIRAQGGDPACVRNQLLLPAAQGIARVFSVDSGFVNSIDAVLIGRIVVDLGGGRTKKEDSVDPAVGIILHKKCGDAVNAGDVLATIHLNDRKASDVERAVLHAFTVSAVPTAPSSIVYEFIEQ